MFPSREDLHEVKRRAVLREAATSFNARGFHATSLADVAKSLGVTKAALYHYFPNKNALLVGCFDQAMRICFASLEAGRRAGTNGRERLLLTLTGYLTQVIDELSFAVILLEEGALEPADYAKLVAERDRFERALRRLVRDGIKDGSITPCDPKLVVFILLGALNWVPRWYRAEGGWTPAQIAAGLSEIFERALSAEPAAALTPDVSRLPEGPLARVSRKRSTLSPAGRGRVGEADRVRGEVLRGERGSPSPCPLPAGERVPVEDVRSGGDDPGGGHRVVRERRVGARSRTKKPVA